MAKEIGGIILIRDDIMDVARAIKLSRATMKKIKQNLFWALIYNAGAIPIASIGLLSPIIAAATMALSSISVIGNSYFLKRLKISEVAPGLPDAKIHKVRDDDLAMVPEITSSYKQRI